MEMAPSLPVIILFLFLGGRSSDGWAVNYLSSHICALEGSSVTMSCRFTYPPKHHINTVLWTKTLPLAGKEPLDLFDDSEYRRRIEYLGDKHHDCSIRLTRIRLKDSHRYYFRFITNVTSGKYTGIPGVTLSVTDLQLETRQRVKEGDSVTLKCKTTCRLSEKTTFICLKNRQRLQRSEVKNTELILGSVRREDAGLYSCGVQGHDVKSTDLYLNVMYPPEKTLEVVNHSGLIAEGDSVNLTCSSESNPPAEISWFKGDTFVASGNIYNMANIRSDHSGEYKCKALNEYGTRSSNAVILDVLYPPKNVSASISSSGDSVNLTCSSESNPPVHIYSWFKENQTSSVGSGQRFRSLDSGWFYCVAENEVGSQRSDPVLVIFDSSKTVLLYSFISGLGGLCLIFLTFCICKRNQRSNNVIEEQENDTQYYQHRSKMFDDHSENFYSNFIPSCNVSESVCDSPDDVNSDHEIYQNLDQSHASPDDVYDTPDVVYDDSSDAIYMNTGLFMS